MAKEIIIKNCKKEAEEIRRYLNENYSGILVSIETKYKHSKRRSFKEIKYSTVIDSLGLCSNRFGYDYIICALKILEDEPENINFITKTIYPLVAKKCKTTSTRVESAIRNLIKDTWLIIQDQEKSKEYWNKIFILHKNKKPTNSQFLGILSEKIRLGKI